MSAYQTAHLKENTISLSKNKKEESGQPLAKKKEEKKKSGQEGQNNLCPHFAGHASTGQTQYLLPQRGQQVRNTTGPVSARLTETRRYSPGKAASLRSRKR